MSLLNIPAHFTRSLTLKNTTTPPRSPTPTSLIRRFSSVVSDSNLTVWNRPQRNEERGKLIFNINTLFRHISTRHVGDVWLACPFFSAKHHLSITLHDYTITLMVFPAHSGRCLAIAGVRNKLFSSNCHLRIRMAYITSTLQPTEGFHPVSISTLHFPQLNPSWSLCSIHLHYILPPLLFVDTHELAQRNASYSFRHWGSRDLERPAHALADEPSELLVNLNLQEAFLRSNEEAGRTLMVEVPMHLRYAAPKPLTTQARRGAEPYEQIRIDLPKAFFRCPRSCKDLSLHCNRRRC